MKSDNKINTVFPREAAILELEKILAAKQKGDRITAGEILDGTGFDIDSLRGRIKTWAQRKGLVLDAVPNDGYRIRLDAEHVDHALAQSKRAARREREAMRALLATDASKLDDTQTRRHEWLAPRVATRVARAEQDIKDAKRELKLTGNERVPLRIVAGKDD